MKHTIYLILLLSIVNQLFGQKNADKHYDSKGYGVYLEMLSKEDIAKMDRKTLIKMAESSRKTADSRLAEQLYGVLIEQQDDEPLHHLYYAQALQTNGRYLKARTHYKICDEKLQEKANGKPYDQRARMGWEACNKMADLRAIGEVEVINEMVLNSEKMEFSPMYYGNQVVCISTRTKGETKDRWLNDNYMDFYISSKGDDGRLKEPELFADELKTEFHEGPLVFTKDEKTVYFTRNDLHKGKRGKSKDGITKLNIYTAELIAGEWANEKGMPFNSEEDDHAHPALTKNEDVMVFASNMKGSLGGMDLWASRLVAGEWTKPVNLGARINTSGDEVFPFIHTDGTLFYASNGLSTLGGLDVFMATQVMNHPDSLWEYPFNVGSPLNSPFDDFGLIMNKEKTEGYFSSNREGGKGDDDIYHFKIRAGLDGVAPLPGMNIDVCVYDDESRLRLENAKVTVKRDTDLEEPAVASVTGEYGYTVCKLRVGDPYFIEIQREGYFNVSDYFIMPKDVTGLDEYCIGMIRDHSIAIAEEVIADIDKPRKYYNTSDIPIVNYNYDPNVALPPTHVKGRVINKEYNRPLPKTSIILLNRCTGEELVMEVRDNGEFAFPLECGCEYVVKSKKNKFFGDNQIISLLNEEDCNKSIQLELAMTPNFDKSGNLTYDPNNPDASLEEVAKNIKKGDVIELKRIFYDYDKWDIRPDAAADLKDLIAIMKKYPSMEIELSSHTDSRGSDSYNEELAGKRAASAREYLIRNGINGSRIEAVGYGEDRLKNTCKICSESDHQENRRTEVMITKFEKVE